MMMLAFLHTLRKKRELDILPILSISHFFFSQKIISMRIQDDVDLQAKKKNFAVISHEWNT